MSTSYNLLVIGAENSGKTSLIERYVNNRYKNTYNPTIEECYTKKLVIDGQKILVRIYEVILLLVPLGYIEKMDCCIITYPITNKHSFEKAKLLVNAIRSKRRNLKIVLIGTCLDQHYKRQVSKSEAFNYALDNNLSFYELSSSVVESGINKIFTIIINALMVNKYRCIRKSETVQELPKPERVPATRKRSMSFS